MLLKVLAFSTNPTTLDILTDCATKASQVELLITSSLEDLEDMLSTDAFYALILEEGIPEGLFSKLLPRLVLIPGMKILLIKEQESKLQETLPPQLALKVLRKPYTVEMVSNAFGDLTDSAQPPDISTSSPGTSIAAGVPEVPFYLQAWVGEEEIEVPGKSQAEIETQPLVEPGSDSKEASTHTVHSPTSQPAPLPTAEQNDSGLTAENNVDHPQEGFTPESTADNLPPQVLTQETSAQDYSAPEEQNNVLISTKAEYTCVLIPSDPQYYLTRAIAERLGLILPWIHVNHGWRLTGLSIRPQHVEWSFTLPIETNPVSAINEIRRQTAEQLFATFPELQNSGQGQDFWAPGYLMVRGNRSAPHSMIKAFMDWTRQAQSRDG